MKIIASSFCIFFLTISGFSQSISYTPDFDDKDINWQRTMVSGGIVSFSVAAIYIAGRPIYYDEAKRGFHFTKDEKGNLEFFDNGVRGLDKFGHIYSGSLFAQNIYFLSRWSGFDRSAASWTGFILASSIMSAMEVHDAYYVRWGFSLGDFIANIAGAGFTIGQYNSEFLRNFDYKISYNFLREMSDEAVIEDYSNMTFWLTANPSGLFKELPEYFPNWLNLAVGISIDRSNPAKTEWIVGLDYNLKRIKTKSVFVRHLINLVDRYHLPAPALKLAPGFVGFGLYF